ncbi:MAG: hypothetical protein KatS3mg109_0373 [Pirellulaceae bacterium]|nr:MAG: hypothetical protein KatS3mg109_0373 [Pirellulaceae bacterium]
MRDALNVLLGALAVLLAILYVRSLGAREKERELLLAQQTAALARFDTALAVEKQRADSLVKEIERLQADYRRSRIRLVAASTRADSVAAQARSALQSESVDSLRQHVAYLLEALDRQGRACHEAVHKCDTTIAAKDSLINLQARTVQVLESKLDEVRRSWLAAERRAQRKVFLGSSCFGLTALPVDGVLRLGLGATLGIGIRF